MYERSLPEVLLDHARNAPDRVFLQDVTGFSATYGEVFETSLLWADAWRRLGVGRGDRVALFMPPGPRYILCWTGLTWIGAIEVGVNPEYHGEMLHGALHDSGAKAALVHSSLVGRLRDIEARLPDLETVVVLGDDRDAASTASLRTKSLSLDEFLGPAEPMDPPELPKPWDIASICYTSGTTGPSKGVRLPWGQIEHMADRIFAGLLTEDDAYYMPLPLFHIGGKNFPLLMATRGGRLVTRERFSASEFWKDTRRTNSTFTVLVGTMASLLLKQPPSPYDADNPIWLLWNVPVSDRIEEFQKRFNIPRVMTSYTQTEMGAALVNHFVTEENRHSAGREVAGVELRIVDENDIEVPVGHVGQLIVRTAEPWRMNAGYHGRPDATAAAWRNGWYHSGDAFKRDEDGWYYFVDRMKDCVRRGGENISSLEVERLVDQDPAVQTSACVGVPSSLGEEDVKVFVQLKDGVSATEQELFERLVATMPRFMLPRYIEFIDEVPKTVNERVQKADLRARPNTEGTWDREQHGYGAVRR